MKIIRREICILLSLILILSSAVISYAAEETNLDSAINDTAAYLEKTVTSPQVGSVGGEWAVIGIARLGADGKEAYYRDYYATLEAYVKACSGVLHEKKYTEYSRVILALTAIGKDPSNVGGYNLLKPLGDYDKTVWQGINGPIWALIALDSGSYKIPVNSDAKTQSTRDRYRNEILSRQLDDGGFALTGNAADPDITAMALQALSKYQNRIDAREAIDKALICLSKMQDKDGGYASWGTTNSESVSQVIVALGELGISIDDSRFVKNGHTLLDNLLTFYTKGSGFKHTYDGSGSNQMATEQAFYAMVSAQRSLHHKNSLYNMSDMTAVLGSDGTGLKSGEGLNEKNNDVKLQPMINPGKTFHDISGDKVHMNQAAIEGLASRGIIGGYHDGNFYPDHSMTRAEFAAIIVRALGLTPAAMNSFQDVASSDWYAPYVGTVCKYGIVNGKSPSSFDPSGTITRQEASAMVARAADLCGVNTSMDPVAVRDLLAQFTDYVQVKGWAQESMAFCYKTGILDKDDLEIQPNAAITRGQIAQMLFNLLDEANLL